MILVFCITLLFISAFGIFFYRVYKMKIKYILLSVLLVIILGAGILFFAYPRGLSLILSYKKECRVMRVEPFMKGMFVTTPGGQTNKFSVACDDGYICRAEDTGFASVKTGDLIEYRGFPEFGTWEEFGKCDHAQLLKIVPEGQK
jgi:hypothetical protein